MNILLSGKSVNIKGLEFNEKEFSNFFEKQSPWREMIPAKRSQALKEDYKIYKNAKPKAEPKGKADDK